MFNTVIEIFGNSNSPDSLQIDPYLPKISGHWMDFLIFLVSQTKIIDLSTTIANFKKKLDVVIVKVEVFFFLNHYFWLNFEQIIEDNVY